MTRGPPFSASSSRRALRTDSGRSAMRRPSAVTRFSASALRAPKFLRFWMALRIRLRLGRWKKLNSSGADPPFAHAQHHAFQVEAADLRLGVSPAVLDAALRAEDVKSFFDAAGPAGALAAFGRGDLGGVEPLDAADQAHLLLDAAVDDGVDIVDGQAGLGDVGGHHRLGQRVVLEDLGLFADGELRVQGQDDRLLLVVVQQVLQVLDGFVDLLLARLEDQDVVPRLRAGWRRRAGESRDGAAGSRPGSRGRGR